LGAFFGGIVLRGNFILSGDSGAVDRVSVVVGISIVVNFSYCGIFVSLDFISVGNVSASMSRVIDNGYAMNETGGVYFWGRVEGCVSGTC
jgi:hypothetical protein